MRRRAVMGVLALLIMGAAGCGRDASADSNGHGLAATAGRACQVIEYDVVEKTIGVRFDSAGGAKNQETYTCVLGITGQTYPDLTLAMSPTAISELIFVATVKPSGAVQVPELGVNGYQVTLPPVESNSMTSGPRLEFGWLSTTKRLMFLRYTFANTAATTDVDALTPRLVTLAKQVELTLKAQPGAVQSP